MQRRMPDLGRLKGLTGYSPKYRLDQVLEDVVADIRKQLESRDPLVRSAV